VTIVTDGRPGSDLNGGGRSREAPVPQFNRERLVAQILKNGQAALVLRHFGWEDQAGVMVAGRRVGESLEHPPGFRWDEPLAESAT
jgi:hypothetical protein